MATQILPQGTASQQASAELHLTRQREWVFFRVNGERYVAVPSGRSDSTYWVRADARGCSCPHYTKGGRVCSHMLAVATASQPPAVVVDVRDDRISLTEAGWQQARPSAAFARMADLTGGCRALGCGADREIGENYCERHRLVDCF